MISGIFRNIAAYAGGVRLQEGDRVRVVKEIRATGIAYHHAPATTLDEQKHAAAAFRFGYGELGRRLVLITE